MAEDHHAISRYTFLLHGGALSWTTKRQEIISLCTTASEYVAVMYSPLAPTFVPFPTLQHHPHTHHTFF